MYSSTIVIFLLLNLASASNEQFVRSRLEGDEYDIIPKSFRQKGLSGSRGDFSIDEEQYDENSNNNWSFLDWILPTTEYEEDWISEIPDEYQLEYDDDFFDSEDEPEDYFEDELFEDEDESSITRKLDWIFVSENNYKKYGSDTWYTDYDKKEMESLKKKKKGDGEDRIRIADVCYKNGKYSKKFCPKPPDCSKIKRKSGFGKPKLCINRAEVPGDRKTWYIVAMKCVPEYENCDKCFCGNNAKANPKQYCFRTEHDPNDDRTSLDCHAPKKIRMAGKTFQPK